MRVWRPCLGPRSSELESRPSVAGPSSCVEVTSWTELWPSRVGLRSSGWGSEDCAGVAHCWHYRGGTVEVWLRRLGIEGQAGLSAESVDEFGSVLDALEQ